MEAMNGYLVFVLVVLVGFALLDAWVNWLNVRAIDPEIPPEFEGVYDQERYARSQAYLKDSTAFDVFSGLVKTAVTVGFILLGGFAWLHRISAGASGNMILQGLVYVALLTLLGTLFGLPFKIYDTFVLEEK